MKKSTLSKKVMLNEATRYIKTIRELRDKIPLGKEYINRVAYMFESVVEVLKEHPGNLDKIQAEIIEKAREANEKEDTLRSKLKKRGLTSRDLFDHPSYTEAWKEQARHGVLPVYFRELRAYLEKCS